MIRKNPKLLAPKVASKALDHPYNATCFQIERSPASYRVESRAPNIGDRSHGAVRLLRLKRSAKTVDAGVAAHPEKGGTVLHGVPIGEAASSASLSCAMAYIAGVNENLTPFLRRAVVGRIRRDISRRNFR